VATSEALRERVRVFILSPLGKWYGLFLLVLILGAANGMLRGNSDFGEMWGWRKVLLLPLGAAIFMGEELAKRRLALGFLVVSIVFAFWSNINFLVGLNPVVTKNYALQGMFFTVALLFCIEFFSESRSKKVKVVLITAASLLTVSVFYLTSGRSGYLAWLVGVPICLLLQSLLESASRKIVISLAALGLGLVFVYSSQTGRAAVAAGLGEIRVTQSQDRGARLETNAEAQQLSTRMGDRYNMWVKTVEMLPTYGLVGAGLAGFSRVYDHHWKPVDDIKWQGLGDPHNQYLKVAVELGVLGLVIFLAFLLVLVRSGLSQKSLRGVGIGVLSIWCLTSLFSSHFTTFHEGHFIWLFFGVFIASNTDVYKNLVSRN
jgi:O-antigen ligase